MQLSINQGAICTILQKYKFKSHVRNTTICIIMRKKFKNLCGYNVTICRFHAMLRLQRWRKTIYSQSTVLQFKRKNIFL